jgi:uncharacterized protein YjiS (DUF1127 family)
MELRESMICPQVEKRRIFWAQSIWRVKMTCQAQHLEPGTLVLSTLSNKSPRGSAQTALGWLMRCLERANQRNDLSELSESQLADIGVTRREAEREAGKWFWE